MKEGSVVEAVNWVLAAAILLILYTYGGYPIVLWLISRFVQVEERIADELPTVTVIIAAYNEAPYIAERIRNIFALDYPPERLDLLIVADGCTDGTEVAVTSIDDPRVSLLARPVRAGKVNAINAAIPLAQGEIVVGSDANCFFEPECLRMLVRHFGDPQVAMVAGEKRVRSRSGAVGVGEGAYWRYESFLKRLDSEVSTAFGATGEVFALRRRCFEPLPTDAIIEDFILSIRLVMRGYRVAYEPRAIACEEPSASFADEFKRKVRIVAGGWQAVFRLWPMMLPTRGLLAFQYVSHRVLRWVVTPLLLPVALVSNAWLALHGTARGLFALQVSLYAAGLVGAWLIRSGRRWLPFYLPFYFVFLNAAALAGAWRYLRGKQPVTWEKARRLGTP